MSEVWETSAGICVNNKVVVRGCDVVRHDRSRIESFFGTVICGRRECVTRQIGFVAAPFLGRGIIQECGRGVRVVRMAPGNAGCEQSEVAVDLVWELVS